MAPTARRALLHFLAIGGAAALGVRWLAPEPVQPPIVVDEVRLRALRAAASSENEAAAMLAAHIDEEILYREALARGYDSGDPVIAARLAQNAKFLSVEGVDGRAVQSLGLATGDLVVRRRLVQRMRAALEAPSWANAPSEAELAAYLARHAARFETPRRIAFRHVFFSSDRREDPAAAARRALTALRVAGAPPEGDPSLAPAVQPLQTDSDLARYFGAEFVRELFDQPLGDWVGPLPATGGFHLVWVSERRRARVAALSEAHSQVREALQAERADAAVRAFLAERRSAYAVSGFAGPRIASP